MRFYDVFKSTNGDVTAVKQGFSWPAFFFGPIWAFSVGLIAPAVIIIIVLLALLVLYGFSGCAPRSSYEPNFWPFIQALVAVYVGVFGNTWKTNRLARTGYKLFRTVKARTKNAAISASDLHLDSDSDKAEPSCKLCLHFSRTSLSNPTKGYCNVLLNNIYSHNLCRQYAPKLTND